jgi:hypothetical protein
MRNTQAGGKRRHTTNSTLAGVNLLLPRPLGHPKQAR